MRLIKKIILFLILFFNINLMANEIWRFEELAVGDNLIKYTASQNLSNPSRGIFIYCYSNNPEMKLGVYNSNNFINIELEGKMVFKIDNIRNYSIESVFNRQVSLSKEKLTIRFLEDLKRSHNLKVILNPNYISSSELSFSLRGSHASISRMQENCF